MKNIIILLAFILIGCGGVDMSKIGKADLMEMVSSDVVETAPVYNRLNDYEDGDIVQKDGKIYSITNEIQYGVIGDVEVVYNGTQDSLSTDANIIKYPLSVDVYNGSYEVIGLWMVEVSLTIDSSSSGEYFTAYTMHSVRTDLTTDTVTDDFTIDIKIFSDNSRAAVGDFVYVDNRLHRIANFDKYRLTESRPLNKYLAFDGINTTPSTAIDSMHTTAKATEEFNAIMFDRVVGEQITYTITKPDSTIVADNVTIDVDCWIQDSDGNNWVQRPEPVLIEVGEIVPKDSTVEYTITNNGTVELGEIVTSYMLQDGATIKGVEVTNKILQEDKVNPVGQLDRSKSIRPKVVKYKIIVARNDIWRAKGIHDALFNESVVVSPTGIESSKLDPDMLKPIVAWLKQTTYKDDGTVKDNIEIPMELRQKI